MKNKQVKFIGYEYREKPSPNRVPIYSIDFNKSVTLENINKCKMEDNMPTKRPKKIGRNIYRDSNGEKFSYVSRKGNKKRSRNYTI